jgi:hypothetical protein
MVSVTGFGHLGGNAQAAFLFGGRTQAARGRAQTPGGGCAAEFLHGQARFLSGARFECGKTPRLGVRRNAARGGDWDGSNPA